MSQLFDGLAALDRDIANRWKIRTHDNVRHVLTAADIDFIFANINKSARTTDITENEGSAIIMLLNASMAANAAKSGAALNRIIHYVDMWQDARHLNLQPIVGKAKLQPIADFFCNGAVSRIIFKSPGTNISYAPFDYIAIGQLILNRDVKVFISNHHGLQSWQCCCAPSRQSRTDAQQNVAVNEGSPARGIAILSERPTKLTNGLEDLFGDFVRACVTEGDRRH